MDFITEATGFLGGLAFSINAIPLAVLVIRQGHSKGNSPLTAWLILAGCSLMEFYLTYKFGFDVFVTLSYACTFICWAIVLFFYYFPRKNKA